MKTYESRVTSYAFERRREGGQSLDALSCNLQPTTCNCPLGFTLIELIVVLALMALVTGFGAVYFAGNVGSSRVVKSARDVAGTVRYGRALAAESGEVQSVIFDLESRSYGIEGRQSRVLPADIAMRIVDQFQGEMSRGTHLMRLLPSGGVEGGTIVLQKGRSIVNIYPDPVVGVTVVRQ